MAAKSTKERESAAAETLRMQRDTRQFEEQRSRLKEKELEKQVIRDKIEKMKQTEFGMRVLKELEVGSSVFAFFAFLTFSLWDCPNVS